MKFIVKKSAADKQLRSNGAALFHEGMMNLPKCPHAAANKKAILIGAHNHLSNCEEDDCETCKKMHSLIKKQSISKAIKAVVGTIRKRKAGEFKKVAEHEWDRVLAEKHILAAATEHKVPKKTLEAPEVLEGLHDDTEELHKYVSKNKQPEAYWTVREWKYGEASEKHKAVVGSAVQKIIAVQSTSKVVIDAAPGHDKRIENKIPEEETQDSMEELDALMEEFVLRRRARNKAKSSGLKVLANRHWAAMDVIQERVTKLMQKYKNPEFEERHFLRLEDEYDAKIPITAVFQEGSYPDETPAFKKCGILVKIQDAKAWDANKDKINTALAALHKKCGLQFRGKLSFKINPKVEGYIQRGTQAIYTNLTKTVIISPKYTQTIAHEVGHALDDKMGGWKTTVHEHDAKMKIVKAYKETGYVDNLINTDKIDAYYGMYLQKPTEVFAQCFQAWVEHNVPEAVGILTHSKTDRPLGLTIPEDVYAKIEKVLDEVFTSDEVKKALSSI